MGEMLPSSGRTGASVLTREGQEDCRAGTSRQRLNMAKAPAGKRSTAHTNLIQGRIHTVRCDGRLANRNGWQSMVG